MSTLNLTSQINDQELSKTVSKQVDNEKKIDLAGFQYLQSFLDLIRTTEEDKHVIKNEYQGLDQKKKSYLDEKMKDLAESDKEINDEIKRMITQITN